MTAVGVYGLDVTVDRTSRKIVAGVSFQLEPGKVLGIVGESGSGKSTVALALLGYARHGVTITAGSVRVSGTDMLSLSLRDLRDARRRLVSYVPQDPGMALNPVLTIRRQLTEALPPGADIARVREVLREVGLPDDNAFLSRRASALSGGQQQRVAIAMAVVSRPELLVLDEPTTGLDVTTQLRVLDLVRGLTTMHRMAAIYISHDLGVIGHVADSILVMKDGTAVEAGSTRDVLGAPASAYTRQLVDAVPSIEDAPVGHALATADTTVPTAAMSVTGLAASYGSQRILHDISLRVERGECVAVVGESGSGKSTLSRCLVGLLAPEEGLVELEGQILAPTVARRTAEQRRALQYVFQNPYASLNPRRSVGESVALPLRLFEGSSLSQRDRDDRVAQALERVRLAPELALRYPSELSGGQRQRIAIARALVTRPDMLICDEITSALDVSVQASVLELLEELKDGGLSMLFITHNLAVVATIADEVAVLEQGRIVESGRVGDVLVNPRHPYTARLLADTLDISEHRTARNAG